MYDTYCEIMEVPPPPTQFLPNDAQVALTQIVDVMTESVPQGVFQTAVLLSMHDSSWVQLVSILASLLTHPKTVVHTYAATAVERLLSLGLLDPELINTWRIDRDNDPHRFKLLWRATSKQLALLV